MIEQCKDDIDYENLDDLPLFDHIEWRSCLAAPVSLNQQHYLDWEAV